MTNMSDTVIEVKNLTKKFGSFTAVDDISFSVEEGEIIGLLGPNGAGKTTTIQMLLGLITPSFGDIKIMGKDLKAQKEEILGLTNFSSSYTHLPWRLTVWENLYVVALLYSVESPKDQVARVIKIMGLSEVKNKTINELSSGWITKVNLARTFLNMPKLMLLDEPTASLDPEGAMEVRREILKFKKENGASILWTSHNMAEVEEICDRVIFLNKGKIFAVDTPYGLANTIKTCRISLMIEDGRERLKSIAEKNNWKVLITERFSTVELDDEKIPLFLNSLTETGIKYSQISIDKPTLEDFFITTAKQINE